MISQFTPEDSQDFLKDKKIITTSLQYAPKPSALTLRFVYGYSAALTILKTINIGNVKIMLN